MTVTLRARFVVALMALSVGLSGCAAENGDTSAALKTPELPGRLSPAALTKLPFSGFALSYPEAATLQSQTAELVRECLNKRGISDAPIVGDFIRPSGGQLAWGGRFGTMDAEQASRYGYHAGADQEFSLAGGFYIRSAFNLSVQSGDPVVQANVYGLPAVSGAPGDEAVDAPARGCLEEVDLVIDEPLVETQRLESDLMNLAYNDGRVQSAMSEWSDCMGSAGYDFAKVEEPSSQFSGRKLSEDEVNTASADVRCTTSSRWADLFYAVLADYQRQSSQSQEISDQLNASLKALQDRSERVSTLVGGQLLK